MNKYKRLRVGIDIGGVLSKYPEVFRKLIAALHTGGAEVHIITDMHDTPEMRDMLRQNDLYLPDDQVHSADYKTHGEGCKAVLCESLGIDILFDDFIGYVAVKGAPVRLLVMPDAERPYYADAWTGVPGEPEFGRRVYRREEGK